MRKVLLAAALLLPTAALAWPWSTDMMNQPSIKPQEGEMAPFPLRSIPVQGIPTMVKNREEAKSLVNPVPVTTASLKEGKFLYKVYCGACHGNTGAANSPITNKIGAISLVDDYVQGNLTEGWLFGTITFGSYVMPAYGKPSGRDDLRGSNDLSVEERWHVVNYIKHGLVDDNNKAATRTASAQ